MHVDMQQMADMKWITPTEPNDVTNLYQELHGPDNASMG